MTWQHFPIEVFPDPIARFVREGAAAIGCDPVYVAMPTMAVASGGIGNSRVIELKQSWREPAVLWPALVVPSGWWKSPAWKFAFAPVFQRQSEIFAAHAVAQAEYKAAMAEWKRTPKDERPDEPEPPPPPQHIYVSDCTTEALGLRLCESPRGLVQTVDELAAWFGGLNQYKNHGSDRESYLSMYDASPAKIDRKTTMPPTVYVPRAFVAIYGAVQPDILRRLLTSQAFDSGLAGRFLFAMPPTGSIRWTDAVVSAQTRAKMADLHSALLSMPMGKQDEPVAVHLSDAAFKMWRKFFDAHGAEQEMERDPRLQAAMAKHRGAAARIALVLHCAAVAGGVPGVDERVVDETSMEGGVVLARWFGHEARRVYAMLDESSEEREQRQLLDLVYRLGGKVTPRDLQKHSRRYPTADGAELVLQALVDEGMGSWQIVRSGKSGGRPTSIFCLADSPDFPITRGVDVDRTPENPTKVEVVSTSTVSTGVDVGGNGAGGELAVEVEDTDLAAWRERVFNGEGAVP